MGFLTSVKNIQINTQRIVVQFTRVYAKCWVFRSQDRLGFTFGSQDDVRYEAAKWLVTSYQEFQSKFHTGN
jgi:hypothetical protein